MYVIFKVKSLSGIGIKSSSYISAFILIKENVSLKIKHDIIAINCSFSTRGYKPSQ